jgi:hypothetical protein
VRDSGALMTEERSHKAGTNSRPIGHAQINKTQLAKGQKLAAKKAT